MFCVVENLWSKSNCENECRVDDLWWMQREHPWVRVMTSQEPIVIKRGRGRATDFYTLSTPYHVGPKSLTHSSKAICESKPSHCSHVLYSTLYSYLFTLTDPLDSVVVLRGPAISKVFFRNNTLKLLFIGLKTMYRKYLCIKMLL